MSIEFISWPKTPRLSGAGMIITEKLDGTNAAVIITEDGNIGAQSRNRLITPEDDNYGFAKWVSENHEALVDDLGPGHHYGEWWGSGIQHGYGLPNGDKRFSLFNTGRWAAKADEFVTPKLDIVPLLSQRQLDTNEIARVVDNLREIGSRAVPGFMKPEGVIVYVPRLKGNFKVLLENNDLPKGLVMTR
ncbi:hypothetical protein ASE48_08685 [Mycobacterium sp. Root265]|uniref:RNA ligase family protein n=1 Tax=Mycobacterium sp. Root265 TaxID=1736504 RepID=UPI00070F50C1|nr:RNA ligase family protein [Mycobacterium sp. Root265]KRD08627.1 hypothetical protein ASE48_08685 [Mycobacterium sp. Root265]